MHKRTDISWWRRSSLLCSIENQKGAVIINLFIPWRPYKYNLCLFDSVEELFLSLMEAMFRFLNDKRIHR